MLSSRRSKRVVKKLRFCDFKNFIFSLKQKKSGIQIQLLFRAFKKIRSASSLTAEAASWKISI